MSKTKWLDIHVEDGYESVTHKINKGSGSIAILPIRTVQAHTGSGEYAEVLVRKEGQLPWILSDDEKDREHYQAVTGLIEPGETPVEAARRELREETGFDIPKGEIIPMIWQGYQSKHDRDRHYIFIKRVNGLTPGEITTDGTLGEQMASNHWIRLSKLFIPKTYDASLMLAYSYALNFAGYD